MHPTWITQLLTPTLTDLGSTYIQTRSCFSQNTTYALDVASYSIALIIYLKLRVQLRQVYGSNRVPWYAIPLCDCFKLILFVVLVYLHKLIQTLH